MPRRLSRAMGFSLAAARLDLPRFGGVPSQDPGKS
jgi:hypothetical protein